MPLYNPITASQVVGLGTAAVKNTGTSGNAVPLLDGANVFSARQRFDLSASALVTSSDGSVSTWGTGQLVVSTGTGDTDKGLGISVDSGNNVSTITSLAPGSAWLGLDYRASAHRIYRDGATLVATFDSTGLDVVGLARCDSLRIDAAPTAETPPATHTAVINLNGTSYKFLCLAA